jgi:hypothetical protein
MRTAISYWNLGFSYWNFQSWCTVGAGMLPVY